MRTLTGSLRLQTMIGTAAYYVLCLVLAAWYPLNYAAELLSTLPSLGMRGPLAAIELVAHGIVAVASVAAGRALLIGQAHGPALARLALVLAAAAAVQSLHWSILPSQTVPGDELPLSIAAVAHAAVWLVFLRRSKRVKRLEA